MNEYLSQIGFYLRAIWRRRWYGLAVAWLVCVAGWIWVAKLPDVYASSARVYIDTDTMLGPLMRGLSVDTNVYQQIDIMQRTLLSRPNLEKVARMTDLDLTVNTPGEMESLVGRLRDEITIRLQGTNLFTISYRANDPNLAKRVVQALLTIFVETQLGASRKDLDQARRFVEDQIRSYEVKLDAAEKARAEFRQKNIDLLSGEGGYFANLQTARNELEKMQGELSDATSQRDEMRKQLAQVPEFIESVASGDALGGGGPDSELEIRILELERSLDQLRLQYTDKHPDVIAVKRRLEKLREQVQAEAAQPPVDDTSPGTTKMANPLYREIKLALVTLEANVATLKQRVANQKKKIAGLEKMVNTIPAVELQLSKLDRDYGILKKNYEELLARRESARIASDLETKADKIQFRIVDPPELPVEPDGPNRLLFLTIVLLGGIGAGLGFGFLLSQVDETIATPNRLRERFVVPVLGTVSRIVSAADRRRRILELATFALVCFGLVGAYGGLVAIETFAALNKII